MTEKFVWGERSQAELATVHPQLRLLSNLALKKSKIDFAILQGIRSESEQLKAYLGGFSKIDPRKRKGRHQVGCAIDFIVMGPNGKPTFQYPARYASVRAAYAEASKELKIPIRTLEQIGDLGHVELPKAYMPDNWKGTKK